MRRLARDGFVDAAVLERTPRRRDSDDLVTLVAMAVKTLEKPTLTNIAPHLEGLHCRTPRPIPPAYGFPQGRKSPPRSKAGVLALLLHTNCRCVRLRDSASEDAIGVKRPREPG